MALSGKALFDTDGKRWKLVGSIRDIEKQKEQEAERLRKNMIDSVTGLYGFTAGLKRVRECRSARPDGVMADLHLAGLRETVEKNGIVFSDMVLEELGGLVRARCEALDTEAEGRAEALRLNREEVMLWLEGVSDERAEAFVRELLDTVNGGFREETFQLRLQAGLARGDEAWNTERLIRMARQAQLQAAEKGRRYAFYQEERTALPPWVAATSMPWAMGRT